jgi:hypothetical protein
MDEKSFSEGLKVSAVDQAREWAMTLEDREARRTGAPLSVVRNTVARKAGVPPSKLVSLRKNRLKDIGVSVFEGLRAAVIRELEAELRHAEHEIQVCRQIGADPSDGEMQSALGRAAKVREALGLEP